MTLAEINYLLNLRSWCQSCSFKDIGGLLEVNIKTTNKRKALDWCVENLPLGIKYSIELDEPDDLH